MTDFKDYFSSNAIAYAKARPEYPEALLEFLLRLCNDHQLAWDAATGNGQAAKGLSRYFEQVIATDASVTQIASAPNIVNVRYRVEKAESPGNIATKSLDLICMAQAYHWVDAEKFLATADHLLKPNGVLAIWCYGLLKIRPDIDKIISEFYHQTLSGCWPEERQHIDDKYTTLPFPYPEMETPDFTMEQDWTCSECLQYLQTWSAVKRYEHEHHVNPISILAKSLSHVYKEKLTVRWPIYLKVGRKDIV